MVRRIRVGILFGGKSAEHEVSLRSAKNVIAAIDQEKYEPVLIGIDTTGQWHLVSREQLSTTERLEAYEEDRSSPAETEYAHTEEQRGREEV
jgi:D-alanine-D-alanine ligase-like ATP-grasp enzyme